MTRLPLSSQYWDTVLCSSDIYIMRGGAGVRKRILELDY